MGLPLLLSVMIAGLPEPRVVAVLEGDEFARRGIAGEIIERPAGISDESFAQQLIDAEDLRSWNGQQLDVPPREGAMGSKAVFAGDGREVIVRYVAGDSQSSGRVCRLRLSRGGMSDARWNAYRWCGSALGVPLPSSPPPPPITTVRE